MAQPGGEQMGGLSSSSSRGGMVEFTRGRKFKEQREYYLCSLPLSPLHIATVSAAPQEEKKRSSVDVDFGDLHTTVVVNRYARWMAVRVTE